MLIRVISGVVTSLVLWSMLPPIGARASEAKPLIGEDLYQLCSSFPFNSQCKGYEIPVALDDRPGIAGFCLFLVNQVEKKGDCKVVASDNEILIYQEIDGKLKMLKDRASTRMVKITPSEVSRFEYREDTQDRSGARIVNTLLFGVWGGLFTRDRKTSEVQLIHLDSTLTMVVDRNAGNEVRSRLEKTIGRPAGLPGATPSPTPSPTPSQIPSQIPSPTP